MGEFGDWVHLVNLKGAGVPVQNIEGFLFHITAPKCYANFIGMSSKIIWERHDYNKSIYGLFLSIAEYLDFDNSILEKETLKS